MRCSYWSLHPQTSSHNGSPHPRVICGGRHFSRFDFDTCFTSLLRMSLLLVNVLLVTVIVHSWKGDDRVDDTDHSRTLLT